ncbi:unnamed protein product [Periconia digitata]|uniref:Uncharacterized protein n=1 Tax=Periconia digitata TaxID=1303443 RepID=A0A9W4UUW2_9PLEO|nr:unnamed protein product [Periconia digitata]
MACTSSSPSSPSAIAAWRKMSDRRTSSGIAPIHATRLSYCSSSMSARIPETD